MHYGLANVMQSVKGRYLYKVPLSRVIFKDIDFTYTDKCIVCLLYLHIYNYLYGQWTILVY